MLNVKCFLRMWNGGWPCGMLGVSHRSHGATQMPFGVIGQTADRTAGAADRHRFFAGWTWNASVQIWEICGRQLSRLRRNPFRIRRPRGPSKRVRRNNWSVMIDPCASVISVFLDPRGHRRRRWAPYELRSGHVAWDYFSHRSHRATQMPCGALLSKNTDFTLSLQKNATQSHKC